MLTDISPVTGELAPPADDRPPVWLVGACGAFFAQHRSGHLAFADAGDSTVLELRGNLADELADCCRQGLPPSSASLARFKALAASLGSKAQELLLALQSGLFRAARPCDMVRADGYHQLWIELTARCNERCVHCYADSGPERTESLDRKTVLLAIADAARLGFSRVQLTGGDPLLCPFLLDAVAAARTESLDVEVFTNGLLLGQGLLESLFAHDVSFAFSLYGADSTTHDTVTRTPGSFVLTVDAIRRTRERGATLRIGVVLVTANAGAAKDTLAFARTLVAEPLAVRLVAAREVGRGRIVRDHLAVEQDAWEDHVPRTPKTRVGKGRAALCADGEVRPCIFTRWLSLGHIGRDGSLARILEAPQIRSTIRPTTTIEAFCSNRLTCRFCRRIATSLEHFAHAPSPT